MLLVPVVGFALQPASTLAATTYARAAAPTLSAPCFTSSNIHQSGTYTVPATGVSRVRAVLYGQSGSSTRYGKPGGLGATLAVEVPVTPGEVLQVGRLTGARGGAAVNYYSDTTDWIREAAGPDGGDAEYISTAGSDGCQHAIAVAGGGGGTATNAGSGGNADAGTGATAGGDGGANNQQDGAGGGGATATRGGSGGAAGYSLSCADGNSGAAGGFLSGGQGGNAPVSPYAASNCSNLLFNNSSGGGGGGGGYYYGGGGGSPNQQGSAGSGGGGSSYIDSSATTLSESAGAPGQDPVVVPVFNTTTTITSSPNPQFYGHPVTLIAHVTSVGSGQPVPGGTVEFWYGSLGSFLGTAQVGTNGDATFTTTSLVPEGSNIGPIYGNSTVEADFLDTTNATEADRASWGTMTQVVEPCAPAPLITGQPGNLTAVYGANVTFSATAFSNVAYGDVPQTQWQTSANGGTTWTNTPGNAVTKYSSLYGTVDTQLSFNASVPPGDTKYRVVATTCGGYGMVTSIPATLTVKGISFNLSTLPAKSYGDAPFDISSYASTSNVPVSFSSATSAICTVAGTTVTLVGAGTCTINADQAGYSSYGTAPQVQQSFTVNKKALIVVASSPPSQPYGTAAAPTVTCTSSGFIGSDGFVTPPSGGVYRNIIQRDGSNILRPFTVNASTPAGNYITHCTGGTVNSNYTINGYKDGSFTITPAVSKVNQTITFGSPGNKTYGDAAFTLDATASSGLPVSFSSETSGVCTATGTNGATITIAAAGTCTIDANQPGNSSYNLAPQVQQSFTVNKATLALTPTHDAISYGDPAPTDGWSYTASGFVPGDSAATTTITGSPSGCATTYVPGNTPGSSYAITCTDTNGMSATNYTFSLVSGGLTVGTRAITVTSTDAGYTYGDTPPTSYAGTVTTGSLSGSDSLSGLGVTCSPVDSSSTPSTPTATTAAGQYSIVCSGGDTTDYSYTYKPGTLTVAQRPITVTAGSPPSQTYGATSAPTISCSGSGFLSGDGFTSTPTGAVFNVTGMTQVSIDSQSNAGSYTTECSGGTPGSNYTIQGDIPGSFTITPASLTVAASNGTMTYGGTVPTITPSYSGFVNGDNAASLTTGPTCSTAATSGSSVGQYASSCSGAADSNYTISYTDGSVTVKPAALAVSAPSPSMTYGDTSSPSLAPSSVTGTTGLKNGDTFSSLGGTCGLLTTSATPTSVTLSSSTPAGTYTVHCSGITSNNYTVSYTDGLITVNRAPLTVTADTKGPVQYSDPMASLTATISGFVNGQTLTTSRVTGSPSCSTAAGTTTVTAGQGSYAIACTVGTLTAANYSFPPANFVNGTLSVTQETAAIQYAGGSAVALPNSGSASISLSATVWDSAAKGYPNWGATDPDGLTTDTPGDVTTMFVQWKIWPAASCLSPSVTPTIIGPMAVTATSTAGIGTASATWSQNTEGSYCVVAQVVGSTASSTNQYYIASDAQVAGIAFYTNTGQFATGGGRITDSTSSTGQGALSFNARYTKQGGAKGQMAYSWQGIYNGQLANFTITSNAISTLSFAGTTSPITATLQGKCAESIVSVATGQPLVPTQGNLSFIATAKDGDYGLSQNIPSDAFSLSVFNSSNQTIKQVTTVPLSGGNLVVHNG